MWPLATRLQNRNLSVMSLVVMVPHNLRVSTQVKRHTECVVMTCLFLLHLLHYPCHSLAVREQANKGANTVCCAHKEVEKQVRTHGAFQ